MLRIKYKTLTSFVTTLCAHNAYYYTMHPNITNEKNLNVFLDEINTYLWSTAHSLIPQKISIYYVFKKDVFTTIKTVF